MIEINVKPASFTDLDKPIVPDYAEVKPFLEKHFNKTDLTSGAALSYNCVTISDYIDILFHILKENTDTVSPNDLKQDFFQAQTILKTIFKNNNNLEKFLTMVLGSIIKVCNEYKQNNNTSIKKQ